MLLALPRRLPCPRRALVLHRAFSTNGLDVLFFGRDAFSCAVFRELHAAPGACARARRRGALTNARA
jgi:hypothetical protein